jgi:hypothetical protein
LLLITLLIQASVRGFAIGASTPLRWDTRRTLQLIRSPYRREGTTVFRITDYPALVFAISIVALSLAVAVGTRIAQRKPYDEATRSDSNLVLGATLTLLSLLVGFSFSMATGRYDQRKNYEEAEANAIGTEYVRLELLSPSEARDGRRLLSTYLNERIQFYVLHDPAALARTAESTSRLQDDLWSVVRGAANARPTPVTALVASGMNDVLNSQGYTQAAWLYRIPPSAWITMLLIAICATVLFGYGAHARFAEHRGQFMILPLVASIAFALIADVDSPRHGLIQVVPQNLMLVSQSWH